MVLASATGLTFSKHGQQTAPTLLFIHGGYWHNRAKEAFTLFRQSG
jgi:acetyl esterase/lipase